MQSKSTPSQLNSTTLNNGQHGVLKYVPKINPEVIPRILPFAGYMLAMVLIDLADQFSGHSWDLRWLYLIKVLLVSILLMVFASKYIELRFPANVGVKSWFYSMVLGVLVFLLWIQLDAPWMRIGQEPGFDPTNSGRLNIALTVIRFVGASVIVPIMEELFWRSFLLRWIANPDFTKVDPRQITWTGFALVTLFFAFEHNLWFAGLLAAIAYNFLYIYSKNLWVPIVSHAVTNALLGVWVVLNGRWEFW